MRCGKHPDLLVPFGGESLGAHPVEVVAFLVLGPDRKVWDMHIFRQQIGFGPSVQKPDIVIGRVAVGVVQSY